MSFNKNVPICYVSYLLLELFDEENQLICNYYIIYVPTYFV